MSQYSPHPVLILLFVLFLLSACAKTPAPRPSVQEHVAQDPLAVQIAHFIGDSPEGARQDFAGTHAGLISVTVGRSYRSALDMLCREARLTGAGRTRAAACKDPVQGWILAPDIFGDGAL